MTEPQLWIVIPAAGAGSRMEADRPKQYLDLLGKPVVVHTLEVFLAHGKASGIVVALSPEDPYWPSIVVSELSVAIDVVEGGAERCHSVLNALEALRDRADDQDWIMVHDAARPCLRTADIDRMLTELEGHAVGGILAAPVRDTLKRSNTNGDIRETVDRTSLWHALTPQLFRFGRLHSALAAAIASGRYVTDEAQAIELDGGVPKIVAGHADNIKITHPADLELAKMYLENQGR